MKTLILTCLLFMLAVPAFAGHPTANGIDSVWKDGNGTLKVYRAHWVFNASTTPDTLIVSSPGRIVEVLDKGTSTSDTVKVSYAQVTRGVTGVAGFSDYLFVPAGASFGSSVYRDFGGNYLLRIIIKATATTAVDVTISGI